MVPGAIIDILYLLFADSGENILTSQNLWIWYS
jgi:hypothetical protein